MILHSLQEYNLQKDFLAIPIFDFLIGNTDRHQSNWAILQRDKSIKLCPLYDNGSSLCCYIPESQVDSYLGNDRLRFKSLVDSKSKSRIRINKKLKKEPTQLEVLIFLQVNHYNDVIDVVKTIKDNINEHNIASILDKYCTIMRLRSHFPATRSLLMDRATLLLFPSFSSRLPDKKRRGIERLRGREGRAELDQRWTRKVTDVRNWFTFSASERWREDGTEYEHYTDAHWCSVKP